MLNAFHAQIAAPVYYYPFILVMLFVVLNVTIAIILEGYEQVCVCVCVSVCVCVCV